MCKPSRPAGRQPLRTAKVVSLRVPVALLLALAHPTAADEPPAAEEVFRDNTREVFQGAATLAGAGCQRGGTPMVIALLKRGEQLHLWKLEESDKAPDLTPALLKRVKDSAEIRVDDSAFETEAYCEAVLKASLTSLGAFANSARHDVTYANLSTDPWKYRGRVIHYGDGHMRRIRRLDGPLMLQGKGIKELYECWFYRDEDGLNSPVCLVCTELPEGVVPGEKLTLAACFDAYFFKRYRYEAVGSKPGHAHQAPLFIGRSFVVIPPPAEAATEDASSSGAKMVLMGFLGLVLGTFVLAFGLHWWFRRNDRRVQARIRELRARAHGGAEAPEMPPGPSPSAN